MICDDLAATGSILAWAGGIALALVLLVVGALMLRRRGWRGVGAVLAICSLSALALVSAPAAQAACSTAPNNSLTIAQTSANAGLGPGQPPSTISGRVTNNGPDETRVTAIVVSISSIVIAAGAAAGVCDVTDYVLIDPRMPVGELLSATGGSALFTGARIGFVDKPTNQDACKGAIVEMHYEAE